MPPWWLMFRHAADGEIYLYQKEEGLEKLSLLKCINTQMNSVCEAS